MSGIILIHLTFILTCQDSLRLILTFMYKDEKCKDVWLLSKSDDHIVPKDGTSYIVIKPLEKLASQKGTALALTPYTKTEAKGAAGKHGFSVEFPDAHLEHIAQKGMYTPPAKRSRHSPAAL